MPDRSDRPTFKITLAQLNPRVGDLTGNAQLALEAWHEGRAAESDLVAMPEMFLTGYQIQDLVMKPAFIVDAMDRIEDLAKQCADGPALAIGGPWRAENKLYNAYHILKDGKVVARVFKHELPNWEVFDEVRLYDPGPISGPFRLGPIRIGTPICEDAWHQDVAEAQAESGADILLVPNGSPYHRNKHDTRLTHMVARVIETGRPLIYLNMTGGQDDQVFDGGSFGLNPGGVLAFQMPVMEDAITHVTLTETRAGWRIDNGVSEVRPDAWEQDYRAMCIGLRDYLGKTGFSKVVLGLSGGIDSAIVATIATDVVGPENVHCVMLPSEYTSEESLSDAKAVAKNLGVRLDTLPISAARSAVTETLAPLFEGLEPDITEENIQSRLRGVLLMALSNKFGSMLLTTGNKSEVAVGYATIYGDMAGGYNPIKDLYKTRVFQTCRWRNETHRDWMKGPVGQVVPTNVIDKPPTAELRADQKDEDSLPPYEHLDRMLEALIDDERSVLDVVNMGYDRATVEKIERLIYLSEYKRFQSAPGPRLTYRAFWLDRRYPIANAWRDRG